MIDRIFAPVLTFTVLIVATLAFGAMLLGVDRPAVPPAAAVRVVQLPHVVVVAKRASTAGTELAAIETNWARGVQ